MNTKEKNSIKRRKEQRGREQRTYGMNRGKLRDNSLNSFMLIITLSVSDSNIPICRMSDMMNQD